MRRNKTRVTLLLSAAVLCAAALFARAENIVYPEESGVVDITKPPYGAVGDGKTDCSEAIQAAVDKLRGSNRTIYFPNGVYLLTRPVGIFGGKPHSRDRFLSYQGQSEAGAVIRLADRADGFGDPAKPKTVLSVYSGDSTGDVMHSFVRNLTVDVGSGNPGAIGLRFFSNNIGAVENVTVRSSDPNGAGCVGLDMSQSQNGPNLVSGVSVIGFDTGVKTGNSFSLVFEHLKLEGQRKTGFDNVVARVTIRDLRSNGKAVAVHNGKHAHLALVDAELNGGAADQTAIVSDDIKIYLRDVRQRGYGHLVRDAAGKFVDGPSVGEWFDGKGKTLFDANLASLRLPVEETPQPEWEEDLSKWFFAPASGDITAGLQQAIDEAAAAGKTTLCFHPGEKTKITGPIRVHGSVRRIIGMRSLVNVSDPNGVFKQGTAVFTFEDLKVPVIVVQDFFLLGGWKCPADITMFDNRSSAAVVVKDAGVGGILKKANPGKTWFLSDMCPSRTCTLAVGKGEKVWARQFNPESPHNDMIDVDGGTMWILGLKTEGRSTHAVARNGAKLEVIGCTSYQSWGGGEYDPPMFKVDDSAVSVTAGFYHYKRPFSVIVEEKSGKETKQLKRSDLFGYHLPLYRSAGQVEKGTK